MELAGGLKDVIKVERFKFSGRLTDETESDFLNDLICSSELASTMELVGHALGLFDGGVSTVPLEISWE